jgi:hypothetical protein
VLARSVRSIGLRAITGCRARTIAGLPLSHPANVRPVAAPRFGGLFVQGGSLGATSASMQTATNTPPTIASAAMPTTTKSVITIWHYHDPRRWRAGHRAFRRGALLRSAIRLVFLHVRSVARCYPFVCAILDTF